MYKEIKTGQYAWKNIMTLQSVGIERSGIKNKALHHLSVEVFIGIVGMDFLKGIVIM